MAYTKEQISGIKKAQQAYNAAKLKGDKQGMNAAHTQADTIRGMLTTTTVKNGEYQQTKTLDLKPFVSKDSLTPKTTSSDSILSYKPTINPFLAGAKNSVNSYDNNAPVVENVESKQFKEAERLKYMQEAIDLKVNPFSTKFNTNVDSKNDLYGYQNDLNSFEPVTKKEGTYVGNVLEGGWKSGTAFMASTLDVLLPTELIAKKLGVTDYADKLFNYYRDANIDQQKQVDLHADTKFKRFVADASMAGVAMIPDLILTAMTGGTIKVVQGASLLAKVSRLALSERKAITKTTVEVMEQMANNPMFHLSFLKMMGPSYDEQIAKGATPTEASFHAVIASLLNAGIEVSGGVQTFIGKDKTALTWLKTALEEGGEEMVQGSVEALVNKALPGQAEEAKWFSMDPNVDAVINPPKQAYEGAVGALMGGVIGGGQQATSYGLDKLSQPRNTSNIKIPITGPDGKTTWVKPGNLESKGSTLTKRQVLGPNGKMTWVKDNSMSAGTVQNTEISKEQALNIQNTELPADETVKKTELSKEKTATVQKTEQVSSEKITEETKGVLNTLNTAFKSRYGAKSDNNYKVITNKHQEAVDTIAKAFGTNVVMVDSVVKDADFFNGLLVGNTIVIHAKSENPVNVVMGHELGHVMSKKMPTEFEAFKKLAIANLSEEKKAFYIKSYKTMDAALSKDEVMEEVVANFSGEMFNDPKVMQRIFEDDPNLAKKIVSLIEDMIKKLKAVINPSYQVIDGIKDLEKVKGEYVKLMQKGRSVGSQTPKSASENAKANATAKLKAKQTVTKTKSTDSKKPKNQFSMKTPIEETRDLIAVHSIRGSEFNKLMELEGIPGPSISVSKSNDPRGFGQVSLLFYKDSIDPNNPDNNVYGADAWTPTFPKISYGANEEKVAALKKRFNKAFEKLDFENTMYDTDFNFTDSNVTAYNGDLSRVFNKNATFRLVFMLETDPTFKPTEDYLKTCDEVDYKIFHGKSEEYEIWLDKLLKGIIDKQGIRNDDVWHSSGMSFEELHFDITAENIVRAMKQEPRQKGSSHNVNGVIGAKSKEYKSIDDIKQDSKRLSTKDREAIFKEREEIVDDFKFLLNTLAFRMGHEESYHLKQRLQDAISDIALKPNPTVELTKKMLLRYAQGYDRFLKEDAVNDKSGEEVLEFLEKAANVPVQYFEAKPMRVVSFDEVAACVLPKGFTQETKDKARKVFKKVVEFNTLDDGDRLKKINEIDAEMNIRFSMKTPIEDTKTLIATHNLDARKLSAAIELGGFAMPSIAIIKKHMLQDFGDITVLFNKDTIDPWDNANKVYSRDAWTPTFPHVSYKINEKKSDALQKKVRELLQEKRKMLPFNSFSPSLDEDNMSDYASRHNGDLIEAYKGSAYIQLAFMLETKKPLEFPMKDPTFGRFDNDFWEALDKEITEKDVEDFRKNATEEYKKFVPILKKAIDAYWDIHLPNKTWQKPKEEMGFGGVDRFLRIYMDYKKNQGKQVVDEYALMDKLKEATTNNTKYDKWLEKTFDGLIEKKGIRNNRDLFTNSGSRRSYEALHFEYTLDNVVKSMKQEEATGNSMFAGASAIMGASSKKFETMKEIKANEHMIKEQTEEESKAIHEEMSEALHAIMDQINARKNRENIYDALQDMDRVSEAIMEVAKRNPKDASSVKLLMAKEYQKVSLDIAEDILAFIQKARTLSVQYFEAKPQRAVGFEEVAAIVAPKTTSMELKKKLKEIGVKTIQYDPTIEGDRIAKINSVKGIQFSMKKDSEGRTLTEAQAEFFKDSKVVNESGNLIPMYHGTPNGEHNVFKLPKYLSTMMSGQGAGFYFTDKANASQYLKGVNKSTTGKRKLYETYLNIKNPLVIGKGTKGQNISIEQIKSIVSLGNYEWFFESSIYNQAGVDKSLSKDEVIDKWARYLHGRGDDHILSEITRAFNGESTLIFDVMKDVLGKDGVKYTDRYGDIWVAWDSNQIKNIDNLHPTKDDDIRYSMKKDSEGKALTEEQAEFFKDSKVVDDHGNLIKVYHGSTKSFSVFDLDRASNGQYGQGFYFTPDKSKAEWYVEGNKENPIYSAYLNIQNPFIFGETIDENIVKAFEKKMNGIVSTKYSSPELIIKALRTKEAITDFMLRDVFDDSMDNDMIYSKMISDIIKENGYDGIIIGAEEWAEYVAFNPNQIKNTDNLSPTKSDDIRYSLRGLPTKEKLDDYAKSKLVTMPMKEAVDAGHLDAKHALAIDSIMSNFPDAWKEHIEVVYSDQKFAIPKKEAGKVIFKRKNRVLSTMEYEKVGELKKDAKHIIVLFQDATAKDFVHQFGDFLYKRVFDSNQRGLVKGLKKQAKISGQEDSYFGALLENWWFKDKAVSGEVDELMWASVQSAKNVYQKLKIYPKAISNQIDPLLSDLIGSGDDYLNQTAYRSQFDTNYYFSDWEMIKALFIQQDDAPVDKEKYTVREQGITPNSKTGMSYDPSTNCPKKQEFALFILEYLEKRNLPIIALADPKLYAKIYDEAVRQKRVVPCSYCYVEAARRRALELHYEGGSRGTVGLAMAKQLAPKASYHGAILKFSKSKLSFIRKRGGLRFFSFSDYTKEDEPEINKVLKDIEETKLGAKAVSKVPAFVDAYGHMGFNIQLSVDTDGMDFAGRDYTDKTSQGVNWDVAAKYAAEYPNVKVRSMAKTKAEVLEMLDVKNPYTGEPLIAIITPYHGNEETYDDMTSSSTKTLTDDVSKDKSEWAKMITLVKAKAKTDGVDEMDYLSRLCCAEGGKCFNDKTGKQCPTNCGMKAGYITIPNMNAPKDTRSENLIPNPDLKPSDIKYSTKPTGVENISVYEDRGYHNLWINTISGAIQLSFNDFDTEAEAIAFAKKHAETLPKYISESNNPDEFEDATDSVQWLSKNIDRDYQRYESSKTKRISLATISENLEVLRRKDLESLAEQYSQGNWDDYEELSDTDLIEALRESIGRDSEYASELTDLEYQSPKFGFNVRPPKTNNLEIRKSLKMPPTEPKTIEQILTNTPQTSKDRATAKLTAKSPKAKIAKQGTLSTKMRELGKLNDVLDKRATTMAESKVIKPTLKQKGFEVTEQARRKFIDSGTTIARIARMNADPVLYFFYNNARNARKRAEFQIGDAQTDVTGRIIGKSLKEIFKPIQKDAVTYNRFQDYMFHMHNVDRMAFESKAKAELNAFVQKHPEFIGKSILPSKDLSPNARKYMELKKAAKLAKNKPVYGQDVSSRQSQLIAKRLEERNPQFKKWAKEVRGYLDNLVDYRLDSGLWSIEQAEIMAEMYKNYVPTHRLDPSTKGIKAYGNAAMISKGLKKTTGSSKPLLPLHEQIARQTMQTVDAAHKNMFGLRLAENINPNTQSLIQELKKKGDAFDPDSTIEKDVKNEFTVYEGGEAFTMKVDSGIYEAIQVLVGRNPSDLIQIANKANSGFKQLITSWSPMFLIRNFVRDLQDVGLYSKYPESFAKMYPAAIHQIATNGPIWRQYKALGGAGNSFFDYDQGYRKDPTLARKYTIDKIEALNLSIEQAPRLAEFMATLDALNREPTYDDLMTAMYNSADVTVNFGRSGTWGKTINSSFVPFFNPAMQGASRMVRRFTETKGIAEWSSLIIRVAVLGILPSLFNEMMYDDDDDYKKLLDSQKDLNYLIKIPGTTEFFKIPKGRVLSLFGSSAQRLYRDINGDDQSLEDWAGLIKTGAEQVGPINPFESNIVSPILLASFGRTWWGGDIEPQRVADQFPHERYTESTSELSKYLVGKLGKAADLAELSPMKFDYILDAYTGVIGDFILPLMTKRAESNPFKKAFIVDSVTQNRISQDFYSALDSIHMERNSEGGGNLTDDVLNRYINKASSKLSDLYAESREVQMGNQSDRMKTELVRDIQGKINAVQLEALSNLDEIRTTTDKLRTQYDESDPKALDELAREVNREVFGAEYALYTYSSSVAEKAELYVDEKDLSWDTYYDTYFALKDITSGVYVNSKGTITSVTAGSSWEGTVVNGEEQWSASMKKYRAISESDLSDAAKKKLYEAFSVSDKVTGIDTGTKNTNMQKYELVQDYIDEETFASLLSKVKELGGITQPNLKAVAEEMGLNSEQRYQLYRNLL